jgi:hypothetical protein
MFESSKCLLEVTRHVNMGFSVFIIPFNSLTAKSVAVGTKLVLFGRYVLNIYVGLV